jgi:hypothetical protein
MNIRKIVFEEVGRLRDAKYGSINSGKLRPAEESYTSGDIRNLADSITNILNEHLADMMLNPMYQVHT